MEVALTLFPFVLLSIILVLANLDRFHPAFRWITLISIAGLNLLMMLFGLIGFVMPAMQLPGISGATAAAYALFMRAMFVTGLVAFLPLLPPVRRLVARVLPIDPASAVHTTSLVYAVYLVGLGLGQQPLLSDPAALEGLDGVSISTALIWAQALGMILLAFSGLGTFFVRNWRDTIDRLGLKVPTLGQVALAVVSVVGLIVFQVAFMLAWRAIDPQGLQRIEEASNLLLGDFTGLAGALTIGLAAALGEELVFRGALQPRFLLLPTAILFTIIHSQYGITPATILILAIALVLGVLRYRTNLTVCILVHFGYNFVTVLLPSAG